MDVDRHHDRRGRRIDGRVQLGEQVDELGERGGERRPVLEVERPPEPLGPPDRCRRRPGEATLRSTSNVHPLRRRAWRTTARRGGAHRSSSRHRTCRAGHFRPTTRCRSSLVSWLRPPDSRDDDRPTSLGAYLPGWHSTPETVPCVAPRARRGTLNSAAAVLLAWTTTPPVTGRTVLRARSILARSANSVRIVGVCRQVGRKTELPAELGHRHRYLASATTPTLPDELLDLRSRVERLVAIDPGHRMKSSTSKAMTDIGAETARIDGRACTPRVRLLVRDRCGPGRPNRDALGQEPPVAHLAYKSAAQTGWCRGSL